MAIKKVRGFILHRREITESSLILSVFSDLEGRLHLLAKGARRKKSPFLGRAELFSLCHFTYYESRRRGLNILSECEVMDPLELLRKNINSFLAACSVVELVDIGTGLHAPAPALFELIHEVLKGACNFPDLRVVERYYELHLLALLGYSLRLDGCAGCGAAPDSFSARAGGVICRGCRPRYRDAVFLSAGTLAILRYLDSVPLLSAYRLRPDDRQAGEMRAVLRSAVIYYLERTPKSDRVVAEMSSKSQ